MTVTAARVVLGLSTAVTGYLLTALQVRELRACVKAIAMDEDVHRELRNSARRVAAAVVNSWCANNEGMGTAVIAAIRTR